jgi:NtrC-family two-component system response regulator AlgB
VTLPPLRQRRRDILPLAEHLLGFFVRQTGKALTGFTEEARAALAQHTWPGNVRELRNAIERGVILAAGPEVGLADLPVRVGAAAGPARVEVGEGVTLDQLEADHIRRILGSAPSLEEAAATLGIDASTLYRKRKRYGL